MKVADYIISSIEEMGIQTVFTVPGGGSMYLNDAIGRSSQLNFVCNLHEQASAIAAEAYAKIHGAGACVVTSGPGATNTLTGLVGAWQDSTPVIFLSGQVKTTDFADEIGVRSRGSQEVNIVEMVKGCTKYAKRLTQPEMVRYEIEKAIHLALSGRKGPVWLDIPLDVQATEIDPTQLVGYRQEVVAEDLLSSDSYVGKVIERLTQSKRPVLILGNGVRLACGEAISHQLVNQLGVPTLLTWMSLDLLEDSHPLFVGKPGVVASRAANFAVDTADFVLSIGARLDNSVTAFSTSTFAPRATKFVVDIDPNELKKFALPGYVTINSDAYDFILKLLSQLQESPIPSFASWIDRCRGWKTRFPIVNPSHFDTSAVSVYALADVISRELKENDIVVSGSSGSAVEIFLHAFRFERGKRAIHTASLGSMGFALPSIVGAGCARPESRMISVDGDGGFFFNVQELETIRRLGLNMKLFVINNLGFSSIRNSQTQWFSGRKMAADQESGLTLPSIQKVVESYGLTYSRCASNQELGEQVPQILNSVGPVVCEVVSIPDEKREPRVPARSSGNGQIVSSSMRDMEPPLDPLIMSKELADLDR